MAPGPGPYSLSLWTKINLDILKKTFSLVLQKLNDEKMVREMYIWGEIH